MISTCIVYAMICTRNDSSNKFVYYTIMLWMGSDPYNDLLSKLLLLLAPQRDCLFLGAMSVGNVASSKSLLLVVSA